MSGGNQEWALSKEKQVKHQRLCLTMEKKVENSLLRLRECNPNDFMQVIMK